MLSSPRMGTAPREDSFASLAGDFDSAVTLNPDAMAWEINVKPMYPLPPVTKMDLAMRVVEINSGKLCDRAARDCVDSRDRDR